MRFAVIACPCALLFANPAFAQEERPWSVSVSGGITTLGQGSDQPFAGLSLGRSFGDSHVRLSATLIDGDEDAALIGVLPAETRQLTLAAGHAFDALSFELHATIGERTFATLRTAGPGGTPLAIESDGSLFSTGATIAYDIAIGDTLSISPFASVDYDRLDTVRTILAANGRDLRALESSEDGVTGTAGAIAQILFGPSKQHGFGPYAAAVTTSNAASVSGGSLGTRATGAPRVLAAPAAGDSWAEYGLTGSLALSDAIAVDLSAIRTAGLAGSEATSASLGLRLAF